MMRVEEVESIKTHKLRHLVLWPHIDKEEDCFIDIDEREDAIHLGAYMDNEIVGVCSLFKMSSEKFTVKNQYRLRAMATHPKVRGLGAGRAIVEKAIRILEKKGMDILWCDARKVALGFYENIGFDVIDEWYDVRNIGPHKTMFYLFSKK